MQRARLVPLLFAVAQISSAGCRAGCQSLQVTVEGQPIQLTRALAARIPTDRDGGGYVVGLFNHPDVDCPAFLAPSRPIKEDELAIRVYYTKNARNVSVNFSNDLGPKLELIREPAQVGDRVEVCILEPSVHEGSMAYQRRRVVVQGLMSGEFCGDARQ